MTAPRGAFIARDDRCANFVIFRIDTMLSTARQLT
jgi:hypothetical protein